MINERFTLATPAKKNELRSKTSHANETMYIVALSHCSGGTPGPSCATSVMAQHEASETGSTEGL